MRAGPFRVSGVADFRVTIPFAKELGRRIADPDLLDRILRPGFEDAAVIVLGDALSNVHRVTGKLQGSIGSEITGHGIGIEAHIGIMPGLDSPAGYTTADSGAWQRPRKGVNTGDPQVYAIYEEEGTRYRPGHPFLGPALEDNRDRIDNAIEDAAAAAVRRLAGRR